MGTQDYSPETIKRIKDNFSKSVRKLEKIINDDALEDLPYLKIKYFTDFDKNESYETYLIRNEYPQINTPYLKKINKFKDIKYRNREYFDIEDITNSPGSKFPHSNGCMKFHHRVDLYIEINELIIEKRKIRVWVNDLDMASNSKFIKFVERVEEACIFLREGARHRCDVKLVGIYDESDLRAYYKIIGNDIWLKYTNIKDFDLLDFYEISTIIGEDYAPALKDYAKNYAAALNCLTYLDDRSLAEMMSEYLIIPEKSKYALKWFNNFPDTAISGLLECSFCGEQSVRVNAQQALRLMASKGHRENILNCAEAFGLEARKTAIVFLDQNPRADFMPQKMPKLPTYFEASAHPAPVLKKSGEALPAQAVETLAQMMLVSTCHLQTPAMHDVIAACERRSLADFALSVFDVWCERSNPKDCLGFLYSLGYLGDDRAATLLKKRYRNATGKTAERVIDILAFMESNAAIAGLRAIALHNPEMAKIAEQALEDVARNRNLSPEMLEDLTVPDLGLDQNGQLKLDFGTRCFLVSLDADLEPLLVDEGSNTLKALPKAVKGDNALLAKAATAQWKEFKTALKANAADQKKRFEKAMSDRREWDYATFRDVVASHPFLSRMLGSLVWATIKEQELGIIFRIDSEGRYAAVDGSTVTLDDASQVTLPHPLLIRDSVDTWLQVFANNKLTQPFPQLARKWFAQGPETEKLIRARDGAKVPLGSLRGLKAKGWEFEVGSAGMIWSVYKSIDGGRASIDVEPGWSISGHDIDGYGGDQTVKLDVSGSDPIAYSELVRDFLSLPVVEI